MLSVRNKNRKSIKTINKMATSYYKKISTSPAVSIYYKEIESKIIEITFSENTCTSKIVEEKQPSTVSATVCEFERAVVAVNQFSINGEEPAEDIYPKS